MIISFAWTTAALLAGAKTVTRRDWKKQHAMQFAKGKLVDAYDKSPRTHGRKVATIRILRDPYLQSTRDLTADQFDREGFRWLNDNGTLEDQSRALDIWEGWAREPVTLWVVEFELVVPVVRIKAADR